MIAPQELRIGNIVRLKSKNKDYVIDSGYEIDTGTDSEDFEPIELTEDWLLNFGFEPTTPGYWSNGKLEIGYTTTDDNIQYEYISITHKTEMTDLKYVHQLQNLIFSLTGEELKIKES
ncbi:hypothetical protein LXM63_04425 [Chryseobacterium gleum]|uniref:hypothetical protein n=1 Tax=Chryseobacterium gleum TaxID=250 RepID=UPI001E501983|nr:hypothetical protein [Chryseobacterium gleum]MCE4064328.1 hypothetical protein [Chryseobacterium gleum]